MGSPLSQTQKSWGAAACVCVNNLQVQRSVWLWLWQCPQSFSLLLRHRPSCSGLSWQLPWAVPVPPGWAPAQPQPLGPHLVVQQCQGRGSSCTIHPHTQNRERVQSVCNILLKKYECSVHKVQLNGLDKISRDLLVNMGLLFFFSL